MSPYILQAARIDGTRAAELFFLTGTGTNHTVAGTTHLLPNVQYFVAASYDGTSAKIYVNGVLENTISVTGSLYYPAGGLGLGRKYTSTSNNFFGSLQGVAVYNTALSGTTIAAHYSAGAPTPVFQLSEVASGGETRAASTPLQPASALTVEAWIKASATQTNYPAFISYGIDTTPYESYILQANSINSTKAAELFFLTGTGTSHFVRGTTLLASGTQYYVVATYDGSAARIYVNGVLEATQSGITGSLYYPAGVGLGLARKYSITTNNFTGTERGVAIYGSALPVDRILARYQAGSPPTIPGSFTATTASSAQINLSWTASTDQVSVAGYLIERCQGSTCTNFTEVASATTTSYNNTGLAAATAYRYRIRSVNSKSNTSDYTSIQTATTSSSGDIVAPSVPTGVTPTVISSSQINLSWTASTDNVAVVKYEVQRCQGAGCASSFTPVGAPTGTSISDTALTPGTTYRYQVRAADAVPNYSAYSSPLVTATTSGGDTVNPSPLTGLTVVAASSSEIDIAWTASTDNVGVTGYVVERCQGASCSSFTTLPPPLSTSYNDPGRTAATSYTYRVHAVDAAGNSGISASVTQTTPASSPDCDQ